MLPLALQVMRPPGSDALRRQYEENLRAAGGEEDAERVDRRLKERLALSMEFEETTRGKVMLTQAKTLAQASVRAVHLDLQRRREQSVALILYQNNNLDHVNFGTLKLSTKNNNIRT